MFQMWFIKPGTWLGYKNIVLSYMKTIYGVWWFMILQLLEEGSKETATGSSKRCNTRYSILYSRQCFKVHQIRTKYCLNRVDSLSLGVLLIYTT